MSFAAGCGITTLIFSILIIPAVRRAAASSAEKAAQKKFVAELAQNPLESQLETTRAALQIAIQERDQYKSRFNRQTILYDNSIVVEPEKIWIIPADVEPIAVGDHSVTYTHFDPKEKRETVHFHPSRQ